MSTLDTLDMVRTKDPVPPSQLQTRMDRDIETICLKCLQKEPTRRYANVLALAEDLRRFRAGEPILARPVSAAERLWRWCLRNKRVAALSAAVALLFVFGIVVLAASFVVVSDKNQTLEVINKKLVHERNRAVKAGRAANEENRDAVNGWAELIVLFGRKLRHVQALQGIREQELDKAVKHLEGAAQAMTRLAGGDRLGPRGRGDELAALSGAHGGLAELNLSRNQPVEAMKHLRQAEEMIAALAKANPSNQDVQILLIHCRRNLGFVAMYKLGHHEEAARAPPRGDPDQPGVPGEGAGQRRLQDRAGKLAGPSRGLGVSTRPPR